MEKADFEALLAQIYEHGAKPEWLTWPCGCVYNAVTKKNYDGNPWHYCHKHSMLNPPGYP